MSDRPCGYASDSPASKYAVSTPSTAPALSPSSTSASPGPGVSSPAAYGSGSTPPGISIPDLTEVSSVLPNLEPSLDGHVNMTHMELLMSFTLQSHVPEMTTFLHESGTKLVIKHAMDAPYLMHEILAISARHLAIVNPDKADFYLHQSVQLQTRAVALFNEQDVKVNETNCVSMLLFSAILGRHILMDVLCRRDLDFDGFLDRYLQVSRLQRGIRVIASLSWPYLLESELKAHIEWGRELPQRPERGSECQSVKQFIAASASLSDVQREICSNALSFIQLGFDDMTEATESDMSVAGGPWQMIFTWSVIISPDFTEMLVQRNGEALVVLAYYALLLHYARGMWQIGDAGIYLFSIIYDHLGPDWSEWLALPKEIIYAT